MVNEQSYLIDTHILNKTGVPIDVKYVNNFIKVRDKLIPRCNKFFEDKKVNPRSGKQLKEYVIAQGWDIEKYRHTTFVKDKTGIKTSKSIISFSKDAVRSAFHKMNEEEKDFFSKKLIQVSSTLRKADSIIKSVDSCSTYNDKRIFHAFSHFGTVTGRLTSYGTNLLNMPRGEYDSLINKPDEFVKLPLKEACSRLKASFRGCIQAPKNYTFLIADLRQIEPRLIAYAINNQTALYKFKKGISLYEGFAKDLFGDVENLNLTYSSVKATCMAFLYGAGDSKLCETLKSAFIALGQKTDDLKVLECVDKLKKQYTGLSAFELRLMNKFMSANQHKKRSVVLVDDEFSQNKDGYRVIKSYQNGEPKVSTWYKSMFTHKNPDQIRWRADVTQYRASQIHKYLRHLCLIQGLNLVLDVHDELVFQVPIKSKNKYEKLYNDAFNMLRHTYTQIPLDYSLTFSKRYKK